MKKSELIFSALLLPVDFVMLLLAGIATYFLRTQILSAFRPVLFEFNLPFQKFFILMIAVVFLFLISYAVSGLYNLRSTRSAAGEFSRVVVASSAGIMAIIIYIFLRQELFNSRFLVLGGWFLAIVLVSLGRFLMRRLQKFLVSRYDFGVHKVLIIGGDGLTERIVDEIRANPAAGYRIVKRLDNPEVEEVESTISNPGVDEVMLADPNYPEEKVLELVEFCHENYIIFKFVPNIYQTLTTNFVVDTFTGVPLIELRRTALGGWGKIIKRTVDMIGSACGLLLLSPVLGIVAFAIKWESEGDVFVGLERISRGRPFRLYKFRSMMKDAEKYKNLLLPYNERKDSPLFKIKNDPRVTMVGRFIRKYRLDELPQLWNVLRGDMSLVGPRPHQPNEIANYDKHHKKVLAIKAGITGMAQISGSSDLPFEKEVALDTLYIENWSLAYDFKILILTVFKLLSDRSAV